MDTGNAGLAAARHLLEHPELADRTRAYVAADRIDWDGLWRVPPWSTREERILRAAADLSGHADGDPIAPVALAELASPDLWDPGPYSRVAEDHSHRVLEALAIRIGVRPAAAQQWLTARYDTVARAMDIWDWGALPTEVDAPTHILSSRRLAPKTDKHLYFGSPRRVFESLGGSRWEPDEQLLIDAARALGGLGPGPVLHELATGLDEEQLASVVEGLYISWYD